jgi:hypothetical protein
LAKKQFVDGEGVEITYSTEKDQIASEMGGNPGMDGTVIGREEAQEILLSMTGLLAQIEIMEEAHKRKIAHIRRELGNRIWRYGGMLVQFAEKSLEGTEETALNLDTGRIRMARPSTRTEIDEDEFWDWVQTNVVSEDGGFYLLKQILAPSKTGCKRWAKASSVSPGWLNIVKDGSGPMVAEVPGMKLYVPLSGPYVKDLMAAAIEAENEEEDDNEFA